MSMKKSRIVMALVITIGATIITITSLHDYINPYVSLAEAPKSSGPIQLMGIPSQLSYNSENNTYSFLLSDKDQSLKISTTQAVSQDFNGASKLVLQGEFNSAEKVFKAEKILYKCPTKYQEKL